MKKSNLAILNLSAKKAGYIAKPLLPHYSKAIIVSNKKKFFIARSKKRYGMYPLNAKFAEHFVDNKAIFKKILKTKGFHVIKGRQFYIQSPLAEVKVKKDDNINAAISYAKKINFPVFVKPNNGSRGKNARIIFNPTALKEHIKKMRSDNTESFLIEKFTLRPEYRIFVVDGRIQFFYSKGRKSIDGDSKKTVKQLIDDKDFEISNESLKSILSLYKLKKSSILDKGKKIYIQETANISAGAKITNYCGSEISDEMQEWAKKLYSNIGLRVFGVDVFTRKGGIDNPDDYLIIEVNSSPALSGIYAAGHKKKVYDIWAKIIKKYFAVKKVKTR